MVLSQIHRNFIAEWRDENRWKHSLTGRSECMFATSIPECVSFDYCPWYLLAETVSLRYTGYHLHVVGLYSCWSVQRRRRLRPWTAQDVWNLAHACTALAIRKFWQLCMIFLWWWWCAVLTIRSALRPCMSALYRDNGACDKRGIVVS